MLHTLHQIGLYKPTQLLKHFVRFDNAHNVDIITELLIK